MRCIHIHAYLTESEVMMSETSVLNVILPNVFAFKSYWIYEKNGHYREVMSSKDDNTS